MHRKFIAFVTAASLAVTGLSAAPARADDDTAKWIAGLAALAVLGVAIAESNKKDPVYVTPQYNHTPQPRLKAHHPKPRHQSHKTLPSQCLVTETVLGRQIKGFSRHCLKRNHVNLRRLPEACALKVREAHTGRNKVIYGGRCLRQEGYRLAQY